MDFIKASLSLYSDTLKCQELVRATEHSLACESDEPSLRSLAVTHSYLESSISPLVPVTHPCALISPYPSSLRREQYLSGFKGVTKWISSSPWMGVRGVRHSLKLDMPVETGLCGSAVVDTVCLKASSSACHSPWSFAQANNYFSNHSSPASDQRDTQLETQYSTTHLFYLLSLSLFIAF